MDGAGLLTQGVSAGAHSPHIHVLHTEGKRRREGTKSDQKKKKKRKELDGEQGKRKREPCSSCKERTSPPGRRGWTSFSLFLLPDGNPACYLQNGHEAERSGGGEPAGDLGSLLPLDLELKNLVTYKWVQTQKSIYVYI